ncbi:S8 family serine peptidase [Segatella maculosa]|uniref:S8 family serine peptidase n=1 Tax=Segatella maculosa TaxID=439703 RepID=UPI00036997CD|nr:S8 family serine peptidase [Segatella maculosa]
MNKQLILFIITLLSCPALAVAGVNSTEMISYPGGKCYMFRVTLKDKKHSRYSLNAPSEYLSQRAIERRKRQHIAIDSTDLPINETYIEAIQALKDVRIVGKSKWNNTLLVRCSNVGKVFNLLKLPFVKSVFKVFSSPDSISGSARVNFKKEFNRWDTLSEDNRYGVAKDQIAQLNGIRMHAAGYRGKGKMIAVLDAGFMNVDRIPCLQSIRIAGQNDFVVPKAKSIFSEMEHGTMVLSSMATDLPGVFIGTAPDASYLLIRCEDRQTESVAEEDYWAEAVEYADSMGVDVINSSLGYHDFDDKSTNHRYADMDGESTLISHTASMLAGKGIVLVNSAGNDGMGTWKKINFPADAKRIITVGSVTPMGVNAAFCGVGPTQDGRIKPDVMAYGSPTSVISGRGTIVDEMGTSFSAPLVAGLVACLWQALPNKSASELIDLVIASGNNVATPNNIYGYGVPDFWKAYNAGRK